MLAGILNTGSVFSERCSYSPSKCELPVNCASLPFTPTPRYPLIKLHSRAPHRRTRRIREATESNAGALVSLRAECPLGAVVVKSVVKFLIHRFV